MSLDDLAGRAAEQARADAAVSGHLDPAGYRERRERRNQRRALVFSGAFVVVALVVAILASPSEEDLAVPTTTIPDITSTTARTTTTTTVGPQPSIAPLLGAGWEELDAGPVAGRYRMAAVWTDFGLFVWGGHDGFAQEAPSAGFRQDGYLYDPVSGNWREVASPPESLCRLSTPRAIWLGSMVFVHGVPGAPRGCGRAALYDPVDDAWQVLDFAFPSAIGPQTTLAWTGELLVAPTLGLAYDVAADRAVEIPERPSQLVGDRVHSRPRAHWTGSEVLVIGSGSVYAWAPGDPEWRPVAGPPVPDRARDSVWTDDGLLVVNYQMATAVLDLEAGVWSRPGDLPLRFSECSPEALAVGGTPVVRMCSGLAIFDEVRGSWIPVPLGRMSGSPEWGWSDLVAGDDEIFSLGGGFLRYEIKRSGYGSIVPPSSMPIGVMLLDVPPGWDLVSSFAPAQSPEGYISEDETIGLVFLGRDATCTVTSTYASEGWAPSDDFVEGGSITIHNPGRAILPATIYHPDHDGSALAIRTGTSDVVFIHCEKGPDPTVFSQHAAAFASGLWSPWETPPAPLPELLIGTGWEELDGGSVAGRMRIATAWTGSEIFVWGGHDGYSQETPDVAVFYQGAELFDPETGSWRSASKPPDGLCPLTEASATWIGNAVLIRGAAQFRAGCIGNAARYDPVGDSWTVFSGRFFEIVPYRAEVVWTPAFGISLTGTASETGEWLAAPAFGVAWIPTAGGGQTIDIPVVPEAGSTVGSPTMSHWTGDRIVAVGAGDVYTLGPGDDDWVRHAEIGLPLGGRVSAWTEHGLFIVTNDGEVARVVDQGDVHEGESLPLRLSECNAGIVAVGDLPVAQVGCSGMAVWDPVRGSWIPMPLDIVGGWSWEPTPIGTDDAIYSIGERFLRYPIGRHDDGSLFDPPTIPVGIMQLDLTPRAFSIRTTIGVTQTTWPDGSFGEVIAIALDGPNGVCHVTSTYLGPSLGDPFDVLQVPRVAREWPVPRPERSPLEVLDFTGVDAPMTNWVIRPWPDSDSDRVGIQCESREDALLLAKGLWLPGE